MLRCELNPEGKFENIELYSRPFEQTSQIIKYLRSLDTAKQRLRPRQASHRFAVNSIMIGLTRAVIFDICGSFAGFRYQTHGSGVIGCKGLEFQPIRAKESSHPPCMQRAVPLKFENLREHSNSQVKFENIRGHVIPLNNVNSIMIVVSHARGDIWKLRFVCGFRYKSSSVDP